MQSVFAGTASSMTLLSEAKTRQTKQPLLVQIFLKGGMDSLSALVPYQESAYFDQRPQIALRMKGKKLRKYRIDDQFALHPSLSPLLPFYRKKRLAFIVAAGLPLLQRSHFDAQDICESGGGTSVNRDGWMSRALAPLPINPNSFHALSIGKTPARSLSGHERILVVPSLNYFSLPGGAASRERYEDGLRQMYATGASGGIVQSGREAMEVLRDLEMLRKKHGKPQNKAKYGRGPLSGNLRNLAELIREKPDLRVATVNMTGWDTHRGQGREKGLLANQLSQLGQNLSGFLTDLGSESKRVVIVVMTEFGRTLRQNGTLGTDHGYGSMMMVLGHRIQGGQVHGTWPGLSPNDLTEGRDLKVTTDYRRVLEEVRLHHLKLPRGESPFDLDSLGPGDMSHLFRHK